MGISTKKGDSGFTSMLSGERVPKYHIVTEAVGTLDEANSLIGFARAYSNEKRTKRILLQIQKHLFIIGSELSTHKEGVKQPKKTISDIEVRWIEGLIDNIEEALALPPGFITFGQEPSSTHLNVARTSVRKAERIVVKMHSENMVENPFLLKYLNRLSDLVFVLACFEEKDDTERHRINRTLFNSYLSEPSFRRLMMFIGSVFLSLVAIIILIFIFHGSAPEESFNRTDKHMGENEEIHK